MTFIFELHGPRPLMLQAAPDRLVISLIFFTAAAPPISMGELVHHETARFMAGLNSGQIEELLLIKKAQEME